MCLRTDIIASSDESPLVCTPAVFISYAVPVQYIYVSRHVTAAPPAAAHLHHHEYCMQLCSFQAAAELSVCGWAGDVSLYKTDVARAQ